ncbi:MAG: DNA adenine methylase [Victivallaceae bacterium]
MNFSFSDVVDHSTPIPSPVPFLKWVGGKSRILETIIKYLPKRFESYYAPFLGGGRLLF